MSIAAGTPFRGRVIGKDFTGGNKLAARARNRARAAALVFIGVQIVIVLMGALGLEGINILRSFAAGESHWSKGQKSAIFSLHRFAETGDARDYLDFKRGLTVIEGDRVARQALQAAHFFGTQEQRTRAACGLIQGGNDPQDATRMVWGFLLFHDWPPFAHAVDNWARGDFWKRELEALGSGMRASIARGASHEEISRGMARALIIDGNLSSAANGYAQSMADASRIAERVTLALFVVLSGIACGIGALFVWRFTNEGVEAEMRAIANETRVSDFAELASDWFCELDKDLRLSFVATRFSPGGNDDSASIVGRNWIEAGFAEGFRTLSGGQHENALRAHEAFRGHRFQQTTGDGRVLHWSISGKPRFEDGVFAGFRITGTDITDMIHVQDELVRARDEAERANKAKSAFLANMSHELRTPLNAILGFSGFIEHEAMGEIANKRYVEYAGDIHKSGEHLLAIINDLLEHSRIEAGKAELREGQFELSAAIEQARLFCGARAEQAGVTLRALVAENLPLIFGDELRFRQVLINLVSNAVKFAPGGTVDIVARVDGAGDLRVDVRDTGIGMDAAGIAQALKPFGQVDSGLSRKFEGTGLGLPLAKSLVELHGGTLSILSEQGCGTVVSVVLPAWRVGASGPLSVAAE